MPPTIASLKSQGFTHIIRACDSPGCPAMMSQISFDRIKELRPGWDLDAMTIDDLRNKMPCKRCRGRLSLEPVDRRAEEARLGAHSYPEYKGR